MKITLTYFAQIRQKAGIESEIVDVSAGSTAIKALKSVSHGAAFDEMIFDESGTLRPVILLLVNDSPAASGQVLNDGDRVQVFSPVAGG
jgi:molybdopterin converting factor small subunit